MYGMETHPGRFYKTLDILWRIELKRKRKV
jgi:hypothetical protein